MQLSYQSPGLVLKLGLGGTPAQILDLQRDLRCLGYLKTGIDGVFGRATEQAVKALQFDLLSNNGKGPDGAAPVRACDYNKSRVHGVSGIVAQNLAACIAEMLADAKFCKIPASQDPGGENIRIARELAELRTKDVPVPFLLGILQQESGMKHYCVPSPGNDDNLVVVGIDRRAPDQPAITSRGYGIGQHTLFHHPPAASEVQDFIVDAGKNVQAAVRRLREKFFKFVNGDTAGTRADDRQEEHGHGPLRLCKYAADDARFLTNCGRCVTESGSPPIPKNIGCDWPYAVRRYNGGGLNSYHYQTKVLLHVRDTRTTSRVR